MPRYIACNTQNTILVPGASCGASEAVQQKVVFFVSFLSGSLIYEIFYVGVIM